LAVDSGPTGFCFFKKFFKKLLTEFHPRGYLVRQHTKPPSDENAINCAFLLVRQRYFQRRITSKLLIFSIAIQPTNQTP